ncbi:unnamed protein product [Effrenium voratum]|nr:unnamed protein product [Effrenium voratum]
MSGRNTRMAQWIDYRVRVTISDQRMLVGTFMAFDKFMNVVLADCEEFRKIKSKGRKDEEKEVKRTLGFVVLRGETIVSLMAEAPPPTGPKKPDIQPGPGRGQVAGRGMPAAPLSSAPAGLAGPVRGVGGPAAIQMQPKAGGALPAPGGAPPGMPPGFGRGMMVPPGWRLGWLCDQLCGAAAQRRAASRVLTQARARCVQLREGHFSCAAVVNLTQEPDEDVPLQHLRAAEQHLAAVERWLRGEGSENSTAKAERLARELGLEGGGPEAPEAEEFLRVFPEQLGGEIFIRALTGSVKVRNFRHPGKIFISNSRLCFYSSVLGVEVTFAAKWAQIASLRLEENSDSHTYPVLVSFKDDIDFDGQAIKELDLRIFEFGDLGLLQKCVRYFVGADLFGAYEKSATVKSPEAKAPQTRLVRTASMISPDEVLKELSMWELERRTNLFKHHWKTPYWLHDGVAKMKWVAFEDNVYTRHPFISADANEARIAESETPPVETVEFLGQRRKCSWSTCPVDGETDELGWQYSTDFVVGNTGWLPYCGSVSFVRRRCWQPSFYTDAEEIGKIRDRAPTTILQNKAPSGAKTPIFEKLLGEISLDLLGASLEKDDWKDPDSLMSFYWQEMGASQLEISDWSDGESFVSVVKGKVRTIEMRTPVPPAPMCPKETRVQSTWHVVILPDKVLLESVTMSLDVPCGTNFNVIACDTFTVQGGKLKMLRTCGVEWLQSTWLKSMVEQNVPPQLTAVAERMSQVVTRWWDKVGSKLEQPVP